MTTRNPSPSKVYEPKRRNAQTAQAGSGHAPEEFDSQNPAIQVKRPGDTSPERERSLGAPERAGESVGKTPG
jgi:hypothetical protein